MKAEVSKKLLRGATGWFVWRIYVWLVVKPWQRHCGYNIRTMEQTGPIHQADYYACPDLYCRIARPVDRCYLQHWDAWNRVMRWRTPTKK